MPKFGSFALRAFSVGSTVLLAYSSSAAGFNSLAVSSATALGKVKAMVQGEPELPWFSESPRPVFRGSQPGRGGKRERTWNPQRKKALDEIEQARTLRQLIERGEGQASIGEFLFQTSGTSTATATLSGGEGFAGEGSASAGGSGSVNTFTGNKATTVSFAGWTSRAGLEVPFTLAHNSTGAFNGSVGKNWSHSYEAELDTSSGTSVVRMPSGLSVPFASTGGVSTAPGRYEILTPVTGGWKLKFKDRTVWNFDSTGQLTNMIDRSGNTISLTRNTAGLLTKVTDPVGRQLQFTYNAGNRIETVKDPMNRIWTLGYNTNGNLTSIQYPNMLNGYGAPLQEFGYDSADRITSEKDLRGKMWTTQYDGSGRLWKETNPLTYTTTYTYTATSARIDLPLALGTGQVHNYSADRLASVVDEAGFSEAYTAYDADNNVTSTTDKSGKVWTATYDTRGNLLTKTNPFGKTWTFTYTSENELLTETTPLGRKTTYGHDAAGRVETVTDPLGHVQRTIHFDGFGQPDSVKDALGRETKISYNGAGQAYKTTDPAGVVRFYSFDSDGRVNATSDGAGKLWQFSRDGWGRRNGTTYPGGAYTLETLDGNGNLVSFRDELNRTTTYTYDNADNLQTITNPKGETEIRAYNANGWLGTVKDGNLHVRTYAYTPRGDAYWLQLADGTKEWWAWSGRRENTYYQRPDTTVVYRTFNDAGRLTLVNYPGTTTDESFGYDNDGRQTSMADAVGGTTWTIDDANRVTALAQPYGTVSYTYNDADQRKTMTEAGATAPTTYGYDAFGRLETLTNRLSETTTFKYDTLGRLESKAFANGTKETYGYDSRDRQESVTLRNSALALLRTESYVFNNASEITTHVVNGAATTYGYDLAGQLESETRPGYSAGYTYDANGNRLTRTENGLTETLSYDAGDKLLNVKVGSLVKRSYTYNAAGSVTSITSASGTTNVTWDAAERVTGMNGPSFSGSYAYNGEGARLRAIENGSARYDQRDGSNVTAPVLSDNQALYTPGISEYRAGNRSFLHMGVKNVGAQTNHTGAVTATREYDAFGNLLSNPAAFKGPFGYGGALGYREDTSGFNILGHRLYDPSAGRFLSRDPIRDGRNWYSYCENDPVNFGDPTGLLRVDPNLKKKYPNAAKIIEEYQPSKKKKKKQSDRAKSGLATIEQGWDPNSGPLVMDGSNNDRLAGSDPPAWGNTPKVRNPVGKGYWVPQYIEISPLILKLADEGNEDAIALLKMILEHELVHWADGQDGNFLPGEPGDGYERDVYGKKGGREGSRKKFEEAAKKGW